MADYPYCEIRVIYNCQLCKNKHTAIVRQKSSFGAEGVLNSIMAIAKKDLVLKFFQMHPSAKAKDLILSRVTAIETIAHNADEIDIDNKVGVPLFEGEVEGWRKEFLDEKGEAVGLDNFTPISTDDLISTSFSGVEIMVRKKLKQLEEEEKTLATRLFLVQGEKKRFETLWAAAVKVKEEEKGEREEK